MCSLRLRGMASEHIKRGSSEVNPRAGAKAHAEQASSHA
jgi:hypothetical protein